MRCWLVIAFGCASLSTGYAAIYSDELGGLPASNLAARGWISSVVSYEPGPDAGSGGAARDDAAQSTSVSNAVLGRPADFSFGGVTRHYASLGNGGRITVTFEHPISDGPGPDFAVFENGFTDPTDWTGTSRDGSPLSYFFAELATVDVSSDLQHWIRFPVRYLNTAPLYVATYAEMNRYASQDVRGIDGLAGKHDLAQGTPYDLSALALHPQVMDGSVNLGLIRYVRITDIVGDGSVTDDEGRQIYDPYYDYDGDELTPYPAYSTEGFDLRAVAVLNTGELAGRMPASGGALLECDGARHTVYTVEHAHDLYAAEWTTVGVVTGAGSRLSWPMPAGASGLFRLQRRPAP